MAGYTRQSVASILNGAEITAPPLNAEFNQLSSAFNGSTGHSHDGSTGNAPKINLATSVTGVLSAENGGSGGKNNLSATTVPTVTDDASLGYSVGSLWENITNGRVYICVGNFTGAAVWRELVQVQTGNVIEPVSNNTIDLGTPTSRFQDLYLSGGMAAIGNSVLGGSLTVSGTTTLQTASATNITASGLAALSNVFISGGSIDGTTIGSSNPSTGVFTNLTTTGATVASADINGGTIDNTSIGATTPSTIVGTNITANTGFAGDLTGDVTGNVAGNLTGNVTGNITGDVTGNVTASSGTSTFTDVTINGTLNMNGATTATITNLTEPTNPQDAATKNYVDSGLANLVASAPAALDTLNELAAAINDDANFSTTITNSIATKLPLAGGTMSGAIAMDTNKITGLGDPTANQDAATKAYVDTQDASKLNLSGGTMTGNIVMGANKVTSTATPTAADDLTRKAYVDSILGSATSAATSASAAATSASSAATSASAASTSEANAAASEANAAASELSASNSAISASASELAAATSEANAAASEANAAASQTSASSSATAAASSATSSANSATASANSAASAATSETNAATSATSASNSASAAATSASSAAASFDAFDDRYLGSKSTAPTTDNDGNSLLEGALYWNATSKSMYVWNGTAWSAAVFDTAGAMFGANNLSDLADAATSRTNLGVEIGVDVQAYNSGTVVLSGWTITESGGSLYFSTGGTNKMKLDASGNLQITGAIDTVATIV